MFPFANSYGPSNIKGLNPGDKKLWCTCGLSKTQPWCDNSHKGTNFKPLLWTVPEIPQMQYSLCNCKYTSYPPLCDGSHNNLPLKIIARQKSCPDKDNHDIEDIKLCEKCGFSCNK